MAGGPLGAIDAFPGWSDRAGGTSCVSWPAQGQADAEGRGAPRNNLTTNELQDALRVRRRRTSRFRRSKGARLMYVYNIPKIDGGDYCYVAEAMLWVEDTLPNGSYRFEYEEGTDPEDSLPIAIHVADEAAILAISAMIEA
jgi:hypothetical protein